MSRSEDGYYVLEKGGYVVLGVAIFLLISIALAFITSYIQLFKLPWGGCAKPFSASPSKQRARIDALIPPWKMPYREI